MVRKCFADSHSFFQHWAQIHTNMARVPKILFFRISVTQPWLFIDGISVWDTRQKSHLSLVGIPSAKLKVGHSLEITNTRSERGPDVWASPKAVINSVPSSRLLFKSSGPTTKRLQLHTGVADALNVLGTQTENWSSWNCLCLITSLPLALHPCGNFFRPLSRLLCSQQQPIILVAWALVPFFLFWKLNSVYHRTMNVSQSELGLMSAALLFSWK